MKVQAETLGPYTGLISVYSLFMYSLSVSISVSLSLSLSLSLYVSLSLCFSLSLSRLSLSLSLSLSPSSCILSLCLDLFLSLSLSFSLSPLSAPLVHAVSWFLFPFFVTTFTTSAWSCIHCFVKLNSVFFNFRQVLQLLHQPHRRLMTKTTWVMLQLSRELGHPWPVFQPISQYRHQTFPQEVHHGKEIQQDLIIQQPGLLVFNHPVLQGQRGPRKDTIESWWGAIGRIIYAPFASECCGILINI